MSSIAKIKLLEEYESDMKSSYWKAHALKIVVGLAVVIGMAVASYASFKSNDRGLGAALMVNTLLVQTALVGFLGIRWGSVTNTIDSFKFKTLESDDDNVEVETFE
jgi:hypothetical protein